MYYQQKETFLRNAFKDAIYSKQRHAENTILVYKQNCYNGQLYEGTLSDFYAINKTIYPVGRARDIKKEYSFCKNLFKLFSYENIEDNIGQEFHLVNQKKKIDNIYIIDSCALKLEHFFISDDNYKFKVKLKSICFVKKEIFILYKQNPNDFYEDKDFSIKKKFEKDVLFLTDTSVVERMHGDLFRCNRRLLHGWKNKIININPII